VFSDSYVKVCVSQLGRSDVKKQTQVQKNSTSPNFDETFVFSISPSARDLETASICIKVMNKELIKGDSVIGEIILGDIKCLSQWLEISPGLS